MWRNREFEGSLPGIQNLELGLEWFEWIDVCWSDTQQVDSQGTTVALVGCTIYNAAIRQTRRKASPLYNLPEDAGVQYVVRQEGGQCT